MSIDRGDYSDQISKYLWKPFPNEFLCTFWLLLKQTLYLLENIHYWSTDFCTTVMKVIIRGKEA